MSSFSFLKELAELSMGETIIANDCDGKGFPVYSADTSAGPWNWSSKIKRRNQYGTIVVGARGSIGFPRLPPYEVFGATQTTITVHSNESDVFFKYLLHSLRHIDFKAYTAQQAVPMLTLAELGGARVFVPPLKEQEIIASTLDTLDTVIRETEAIIDKLKAVKQGLLHDLLTRGIDANGELRPPQSKAPHLYKQSPLGLIPNEWNLVRLGKIAPLQRGHDIVGTSFKHGPYPVISSSGVIGFHSRSTTEGPNVVVGRKGSIGTVHYVESDFWAHDTSLFVTDFCGNDRKFVFYLYSYLKLGQYGTKSGSPSLNRNDLHPLLVGRPEPEEQRTIVSMMESHDGVAAKYEAEVDKLRCLKKGLMDDLLTGRVRVTPLLKSGGKL
jgi:type I restriction enzyme S subunit